MQSKASIHSELATEWIFIIISLVVAGIGMLLGGLFYVWRPRTAGYLGAKTAPALRRELQQILG